MPKKITLDSQSKLQLLLDAIDDRKAIDPTVIDLRDKVNIADFLLICTGTSTVQIRSIAERVLERIEEEHWATPKVEGQAIAEWVLMDFGDVILHIMAPETRERYRLEQFWTTVQPKGALPPTPDATAEAYAGSQDETDFDALGNFDDDDDEDELDEEDLAFFAAADKEVDPIDEDGLD